MTRKGRISPAIFQQRSGHVPWLALLIVTLLATGCGAMLTADRGTSPASATTLPTETPAPTAPSIETPAPTDTPPLPAAPEQPTGAVAAAGPLDGVREALAAYEPVADARPAAYAVLEGVAAWLADGGEAEALPEAIGPVPMPGGAEPAMALVWATDLTGDDRPDTVLYIPVMGLPLFLFTPQGGDPRPAGHILPPDMDAIQADFPVVGTEMDVDLPGVDVRDLTGDGLPEVLFSTIGAGGSSYRLLPRFYRWHEGNFHTIFAATLVNWAGESRLALEPDPAGEGRSQIVLTYPQLYGQGFDHKMVNHPIGRQVWRWSPGAGRYVPAEQSVDLEAGGWSPEMPPTVEDRLRWLTNEAEVLFRSGEYGQAVTGYDAVLRLADEEDWQPGEGEGNWPALAAFRRAEALLLSDDAGEGREEMAAVAEAYAGDLLGEMAAAFLEGYGQVGGPEAAARGVAAMQDVPLWDHFYYEEPGALRFPMDAAGILYPGAGLAAYLQAHPELASDPSALQAGLTEAGYTVMDVIPAEAGAVEILLAARGPSDPVLQSGSEPPPISWRLAPPSEAWHVSPPAGEGEDGWPTVGSF
ncbi:MAG: hypothetical protein RBU35_21215 [Anaerolineae bacterium]|jgi:hypothetical protein|nr:hypothetical protein [Anaerolineae bacterium]